MEAEIEFTKQEDIDISELERKIVFLKNLPIKLEYEKPLIAEHLGENELNVYPKQGCGSQRYQLEEFLNKDYEIIFGSGPFHVKQNSNTLHFSAFKITSKSSSEGITANFYVINPYEFLDKKD